MVRMCFACMMGVRALHFSLVDDKAISISSLYIGLQVISRSLFHTVESEPVRQGALNYFTHFFSIVTFAVMPP